MQMFTPLTHTYCAFPTVNTSLCRPPDTNYKAERWLKRQKNSWMEIYPVVIIWSSQEFFKKHDRPQTLNIHIHDRSWTLILGQPEQQKHEGGSSVSPGELIKVLCRTLQQKDFPSERVPKNPVIRRQTLEADNYLIKHKEPLMSTKYQYYSKLNAKLLTSSRYFYEDFPPEAVPSRTPLQSKEHSLSLRV